MRPKVALDCRGAAERALEHELARTVVGDPQFAVADDTEAGAGVSAVRWTTSEGLTAVAFGGHVWQLSAASGG